MAKIRISKKTNNAAKTFLEKLSDKAAEIKEAIIEEKNHVVAVVGDAVDVAKEKIQDLRNSKKKTPAKKIPAKKAVARKPAAKKKAVSKKAAPAKKAAGKASKKAVKKIAKKNVKPAARSTAKPAARKKTGSKR